MKKEFAAHVLEQAFLNTDGHIPCSHDYGAKDIIGALKLAVEVFRKPKRFIYHFDTWWWGDTVTIITTDGMATVRISINYDYDGWGYVNSLMVHESQRGKGVGRELMQEVDRYARSVGMKYLFLGARKTSFVVGWYMRLGYYVCKDCREEGTDQLFTMKKNL